MTRRTVTARTAPPPMAIAAVAGGDEVTVAGRIRAVALLRGRFTGRACVYYRAAARELCLRDEKTFTLEERFREERRADFFVDDGTGAALVETADAAIAAPAAYGMFRHATPEQLAFLASQPWRGERQGWDEVLLCDGDEVIVRGTAFFRPGPGPFARARGYRDVPLRLVIRAVEIRRR